MKFLDRVEEMRHLDRLARSRAGGLAVLYGRRRIGKTRLLLEWVSRHSGLYTVADLSSAGIQRKYVAEAIAGILQGFSDVEYPDWRGLLSRLAREARAARWRGPIVFDEFPYLVLESPELPSVLQQWIDHEAREARLVVAIAGSSQRMMQGLVLAGDAPLYGRAKTVLDLRPLPAKHLREAVGARSSRALVEAYAAWGGVPRYWELAAEVPGEATTRIDRLVLDPLGPLHREPDRILIEEVPSALEVRPLLDAIGAGAHRVSEIAGRIGRPATSLSRPLDRLVGMGLVRRETPFGEPARRSRRSLYKIADPFFRLWFRIVAPNRGQLASGTRRTRLALLRRYWTGLVAQAWEELCLDTVPRMPARSRVGRLGPWGPASRWWRGNQPEWDIVSQSVDGSRLLLGEVKWNPRRLDRRRLKRELDELAAKPLPILGPAFRRVRIVRALFIPEAVTGAAHPAGDTVIATGDDLLGIR